MMRRGIKLSDWISAPLKTGGKFLPVTLDINHYATIASPIYNGIMPYGPDADVFIRIGLRSRLNGTSV